MTSQSYARMSAWWREHPGALSLMLAGNKALKYLGYAVYPLLLVLLLVFDAGRFPAALLAPAVGFVVTSFLRILIDERRPYEALDIHPLIEKDTAGRSFPSRHMYSITVIAVCWLSFCVPAGIVLLLLCALMGFMRVVGGVHYAHDVAAGAVLGVLFGLPCFIL